MAKKPKTIFDTIRSKSWKREVAVGLLSVFLYFTWITLTAETIPLIEARSRVLDLLIYPVFLFVAGAYGMQAFTAQYLPNKAQTDRLRHIPTTQEEIGSVTPPLDPDKDVTVVDDADDFRRRGL